MRVEHLELDSQVLGRAILAIHDFDPAAIFASFEQAYVTQYQPRYVSAKIPIDQIHSIQAMESHGFRFVEAQISGVIAIRKPPDYSHLPYRYEQVTTEAVLEEVLAIARATFDTDRFSKDPAMGADFAGRRYQAYVRKSFGAPDEGVYRLYDPADGKTLAFKSHKVINPREVYGLLGGVRPDLKGGGLGMIIDGYSDARLLAEGCTRIRTAISASNLIMVRYLVGTGSLKVQSISVVLRKIYSE